MTATTERAPARPVDRRVPLAAAGRLLRLELRRNAMLWMLPVVGALFWFLSYRRSLALPPMWNVRAMSMQGTTIAVFIPTVVGAAAWTASREARRGLTDLLGVTPRPRWVRQLAAWAATAAWSLVGYLVCVGVLYAVTASQAAWGGPLWWPAVIGAASLPALAALGFAAGALIPSRFTPPLAAVGAFVALEASLQLIQDAGSPWMIAPLVAGPWNIGNNEGLATFYRYLPDLSIAQLIFLAGLTAVLLGILGLPAGAGGRWLRGSAAALTAAGVLAAGIAVGLAGTGRLDPHGMIAIPALHNPADDRAVAYTPVCSQTAIPICLHPAYTVYLPALAEALRPVLDDLAGLPGAPTRISQVALTYHENDDGIEATMSTRTAGDTRLVHSFVLPNQLSGPTMTVAESAAEVKARVARNVVAAVVGDGSDRAQQAVAAAILGADDLAPGSPVAVAAQRFAALPAADRHAWLLAHAPDLRAGRITLEQVP
jgi:hypothetical protein